MYIDPITRQTFNHPTPIPCVINPENIKALDPDTDELSVLTHKRVLGAIPMLFEPKRVQSATSPNTFTAQEAENFFPLQS